MTSCLATGARTLPGPLRVPQHAHYRAIFCGADGTETSLAYSRALSADLARLAAAGLGTADALSHLQQEACGGRGGRHTQSSGSIHPPLESSLPATAVRRE